MNANRYIVRHEYGSDYAVVDTARPGTPTVASGLTSDEAEDAAANMNVNAVSENEV